MKQKLLLLLMVVSILPLCGLMAEETPEQRDTRMKWWREAKFGMFIHWGVYSVPAGTYHGEQSKHIGEWIMRDFNIPVAEYRGYAKQFNPTNYNPEFWAKLAKQAGMKYIVITAKHHDGFALFPSDVTDWDVADATPYKKDLITPLAKAAHRNGLKFGTYYSQAQDWTNPGGAKARGVKEGDGWDDAHKGNFDEYLAKIAGPQVREILTRIRPDVLWWDTPVWMTAERAKPLDELLVLRPGLITNNRLGGGYRGDTETPEQHIPATGFKDRDWETCMTMNDTWGFKSFDDHWKPTTMLIRNLVDIVSKGGNYLLNVGPNSKGEIPEPSIQRLKEIGDWMDVNGQAIYKTTASPFSKLSWGRCTKKVTKNGGVLYLHVFDWPTNGQLVVPGLLSKVTSAQMLATREKVGVQAVGENVVFSLPTKAPDAIASVVEVKFFGLLKVERHLQGQEADGSIVLSAETADIHNSLRARAKLEGKGPTAKITNWTNAEGRLSWEFQITKPGNFRVQAMVGQGSGKLLVMLDQAKITAEVKEGEGSRTVELGTVMTSKSGSYGLELRPDKNDWKGFDLQSVTLQPIQP